LQTVFGHEDRIDDSNWLTSTLIDLMLWRLATQYTDVHFLATDFCHLHLPSITRQAAAADAYKIRDVLGRPVDATSTRPIVFVANVSHIHWNLLRVQFRPHVELQLFEPMGYVALLYSFLIWDLNKSTDGGTGILITAVGCRPGPASHIAPCHAA
jgi:hypothetical protein